MLALLPNWLEPDWLLDKGGLALLTAIVFAESGLLFGFFLPGDSLLFFAGFLASDAGGNKLPALPIVVLCVVLAAIVGDQVGYIFGKAVGPSLFDRPKSRFFNPRNVVKAHAFFERHGPKAIVLARFVPIVRTFTPIMAGVARMRYRTFVVFNVIGALLWGAGVVTLGYFLGEVGWIKDNVEIAALFIVALSLVPVVLEIRRHRRERGAETASDTGLGEPAVPSADGEQLLDS